VIMSPHLLTGALALLCLTHAARAGDRAAFENSIADLTRGQPISPRPNELSFLVGIGDAYCQMKQAGGGGPLDIQVAMGRLHQSYPETRPMSADEAAAQNAAAQEASKLLCP
jgi:hypothetical protein